MTKKSDSQAQANTEFWDELCGTQLATHLGISDASPASLAKFDTFYFQFYPYLEKHIPFEKLAGKLVLEVGLGYGSVAEKLAKSGAIYTGLDVARGPVEMARLRLKQHGLPGSTVQGSVLDCPFEDNRFDQVVAIGCYHHTGDLHRALDETWRVLKPGGQAMIMVYYVYSYRLWMRWPLRTMRFFLSEKLKLLTSLPKVERHLRAAYDADSSGEAAPETVFVSKEQLRNMTRRWSRFEAKTENIGMERLYPIIPRRFLLRTLGSVAGLDIYISLQK